MPTLVRHEDKVRWIWEGLHDPEVECIIVCGPASSGKFICTAEAIRRCRTRRSWNNEVLLWNFGEVPVRVPLPANAPFEEDEEKEGARGVIVLRPCFDDKDDGLVRALLEELGADRCILARFVADS